MKFSTAELLNAFILSSAKASPSAHAGEKRQNSATEESTLKKNKASEATPSVSSPTPGEEGIVPSPLASSGLGKSSEAGQQGEASAPATAGTPPPGDLPNSSTNALPTPPSPKNVDEREKSSPDRSKGPSDDSTPDAFSFLLSHPYLEKFREAPSQDPEDVAQEAVSNLLRAGCLFAQVAWQARPLSDIAELRQKVETLRTAKFRLDETCSKLNRQLASEADKTSKI